MGKIWGVVKTKRFIGIVIFATSHLLGARGDIDHGTADLGKTIGGTLAGIGQIAADKRKEAALKAAVK